MHIYRRESLAWVKLSPQPEDENLAALKTISIETGGARYDALVGSGLLKECGPLIAARLQGPRCVVVADEKTADAFRR